MAKQDLTVSERLKAAIQASGVTRYRIAQETGVSETSLSRFMSGARNLDLPSVDKLARFLGLDLLPRGRKSTRKAKR